MSGEGLPSEDDDLLAAELAFGLIDGEERRDAEDRTRRDPVFRDAHRRWQKYAITMLQAGSVTPSPSVWKAIEARLPANDDRRAGAAALRWWQAATAAGVAAALALGFVAIDRQPMTAPTVPTPQSRPPLVAVLTGEHAGALAVSFDRDAGRLSLAPSGLDLDGRDAELWVIPADGRPRSLGVVAGAAGSTRPPPPLARVLEAGVTLAISVEPIGGSPTGQPTGPVILSGKMTPA
jgi:anti-sigma-K factor RskA